MNRIDPSRAYGYFGEWLAKNMQIFDVTVQELAEYVGISVQSVSYHIHHFRKPSFPVIKLYALFFTEDPLYVYELVLRDWL